MVRCKSLINPAPDQVQRIIFESNALQPGLSRVTFNLYQGNWNALPDFTQLSIDKSGTMSTNWPFDVSVELDGANRLFRLNHGDTMDRWSAPPIEGRPFAISATVVAQGDGLGSARRQSKRQSKTAWRCICKMVI